MAFALLAHVTIGSVSQYTLVGLIGLAAGLSVTILANPSEDDREVDSDS